ncbi:2-dehydro-3-deoxy-6-phosphogalactonate aldolase [Escherichia coli]|nr:2-dehydro-3-deoxy-6-phosphogalactonate aldolase [Escherichia coli]EEQ7941311.1 2-dehydro-3-deoxy-6-phosphogalactonate aldolase [Escherichia coli]EEW0792913.1 2-dehydro-3-deoxy-6-phosphogalactonate aldolase [Escherichia coli]EEZ3505712.1 2-dehydro-3-deoxy-6-phosphogalactonate aldolase [Escherichia coli]EFH2201539.1 2-dehydro-3-deoxy-6-phosphogalactonate aldolase [Escherichia coli]
MTARYIAIDWGSTNLRAWLYQGDHCLDSRQSEAGVTRLNGKSPAAVLAEVTTDWREENTPVVMAGMVGSNVGWKVAPYLSVPARFSSIGDQLTSVGDNIWIIPGLCVSHDDNHNVMRGEETQLIGARTLAPSSLYVMPGTHCKWVQADSQQINDFRTVMTGELHHLLLNHSLIGAGLPPQENSADAFAAGLERGLNAPAILPQLFEVRASHVLGTLPREQVSEFLSGLLIGAEVAILRGIKPDEALAHVGAVIDAGFDAVEIPLNSPQWEQSIPAIVDAYGDKALIGAGTVLKPEQVDALARMGCQLIVTPNIHSEVIRRAVGYGMTVCPGCATATEAFTALEAGAQALKIFPSSAFGPQYIKALKAVLPSDIAVFAVGGVTPENLAQWIDAGCAGAGLGSDLYRAGQSVERTAQQAAAFVKAYREAVQ